MQQPYTPKDCQNGNIDLVLEVVDSDKQIVALKELRLILDLDLKTCKYIIDKAYGANTAFLLDGTEDTAPTVIRIVLPGLSPRRIPKTALFTKPVCTSRPKLLSKSSTF